MRQDTTQLMSCTHPSTRRLSSRKCRKEIRVINETDDRNAQKHEEEKNIKIFSSSLMGVESITCKMTLSVTVSNNAPTWQ